MQSSEIHGAGHGTSKTRAQEHVATSDIPAHKWDTAYATLGVVHELTTYRMEDQLVAGFSKCDASNEDELVSTQCFYSLCEGFFPGIQLDCLDSLQNLWQHTQQSEGVGWCIAVQACRTC